MLIPALHKVPAINTGDPDSILSIKRGISMDKTHPMLLLSTKKAILMDRAVKSKLLSTKQEVLVDRNGNIKRIYI